MLSRDQAKRIVEDRIRTDVSDCEVVVLDSLTIERPYGWVFFYNSREFVETSNELASLAGNAPYIVNRNSGSLVATGTAHPLQHYLSAYESTLGGI